MSSQVSHSSVMGKVLVKKPSAIVLDFMSTAIKAGFIEKALYKYLRTQGRQVISQKWEEKSFKDIVAQVRKQVRKDSASDQEIPKVSDKTASMEEQQESLFNNMVWMMDHERETDAHYRLKFAIYEEGYNKGIVFTHVYQDVARNIPQWKSMGMKIFFFSHAWIQTQKLFMKFTNHGELFSHIDNFFDTQALGPMNSPESYERLAQAIGLPKEQILFLTKGTEEGNAAKAVGIHSILVVSHSYQLQKYNRDDLASFERIRSFDELGFKESSARS